MLAPKKLVESITNVTSSLMDVQEDSWLTECLLVKERKLWDLFAR